MNRLKKNPKKGINTLMSKTKVHAESGFTLVELSIVLTIVGLLIAGVLRGQEMIQNGRVVATVSQVKSYEAAVATFKSQYGGMPGDIVNASERVPGCNQNCDPFMPGGGNNIVGNNTWMDGWFSQVTSPMPLPAASEGDETLLFWLHLAKADMISGITDDVLKGSTIKLGDSLPSSRFNGGFVVGYGNGAFSFADAGNRTTPYGMPRSSTTYAQYTPILDFALHVTTQVTFINKAHAANGNGGGNGNGNGGGFGGPGCPGQGNGPGNGAGCGIGGGNNGGGNNGGGSTAGITGPVGLLVALITDPLSGGTDILSTPGLQPMTPTIAARIDRKMDDGAPATGYVQAYGVMSSCFISDTDLQYNEAIVSRDCGLVFSISQ